MCVILDHYVDAIERCNGNSVSQKLAKDIFESFLKNRGKVTAVENFFVCVFPGIQ